jgi:hypothetical protein
MVTLLLGSHLGLPEAIDRAGRLRLMGEASPDEVIIGALTRAFGSLPRPEHSTHHTHCDECWEHDELLQQRTLATLAIEDVGSQAWNPITMCTPEAFAYWLPALARLALEPEPVGWDWYGYIILFELRWDGARNERWAKCSPEQRLTVARLLEHLDATRSESIGRYDCSRELMQAWEIWSDAGEPTPRPRGPAMDASRR